MAELKTKKTRASVRKFLDGVEPERRRADAKAVAAMMEEATGAKPAMWGPSIVGFGDYRYRYESGREGDWFLIGFSPRKTALVLYVMSGFPGYEDLLKKVGPITTGRACVYVKKLDDLHEPTLRRIITKSVAAAKKKHLGD